MTATRRLRSALLRRVEARGECDTVDDPPEVATLLGGVEKPAFRLSGLLDDYAAINRAPLTQVSPD